MAKHFSNLMRSLRNSVRPEVRAVIARALFWFLLLILLLWLTRRI